MYAARSGPRSFRVTSRERRRVLRVQAPTHADASGSATPGRSLAAWPRIYVHAYRWAEQQTTMSEGAVESKPVHPDGKARCVTMAIVGGGYRGTVSGQLWVGLTTGVCWVCGQVPRPGQGGRGRGPAKSSAQGPGIDP